MEPVSSHPTFDRDTTIMKFLIVLSIVASVLSDENSETILRRSNDKFTSQMFAEVVKSHPGESVVLSAFSVLSPVAQLALASVGESHDEALQLLGFSDDNVTKAVFQENNKKLRNVEGVELKIANCIYIRTGAELNDNFAAVSRDTFGSEVKNADFTQNVATAKEINTWVEEHTNNRIKDLVNPDSLDGDTAAVLVNAIYFKGTWKNVFDERFTSDRDFHVTKDKTIQVPMMYQTDEYKYGESKELDAKLLELPYIGDQSSLLIVLPNEIDGITSLEEKLKNTQLLENAVQQMSVYDVDVSLPKFKIETTTNLKEVLMTLGVKKLFSPGEARLDNLIKGASDLYISEAIQKAFIEVNEKGSEAAAANQLELVDKIFVQRPLFEADRPFYFQLNFKNISLFSGVSREPAI